MGFTVLSTGGFGGRVATYELENEALAPIGAEIVVRPCETRAQYYAALADVDAVYLGRWGAQAEAIGHMKKVKVIATTGIGLDSIDVEAATAAGIAVVNVPDVFTEEVADQAFALFLAVNRRLVDYHSLVIQRGWGTHQLPPRAIPKIAGSTLGLVAFGNIGRAMARRARGFGMHLLASDPFVPPDTLRQAGVTPVALDDLCRQADVISCHVPLLRTTHHLLTAHHFALMKPTAIFINTSRGPVVNEPDLIAALQQGRLLGAGLDVTEIEPIPPDNPLLSLPNVVLTPHMASRSDTADIERRRRAGQNIAAVLAGQRPRNLVNQEVAARLGLT
jgi:D-3-phosphoglycerate dehydrogenase